MTLAVLPTGCAVPETRLRGGSQDAGLAPPLADRMAKRMADLPAARDAQDLPAFLRRVRALGDPRILGVTGSAAALYATGIVH